MLQCHKFSLTLIFLLLIAQCRYVAKKYSSGENIEEKKQFIKSDIQFKSFLSNISFTFGLISHKPNVFFLDLYSSCDKQLSTSRC